MSPFPTALRMPLLTGLLVAAVGIPVVAGPRPAFLKWMDQGLRDEHDAIATNLVLHGRYGAHLDRPDIPTVARGPLYPFYLAGIFKAFGVSNLRAVRVADQIVHAVTAALIAGALQGFVPALAAMAAGLLYAFWPTTFYYVVKGGSETIQILWLAASFLCLVRFRRRPGTARAIALGISLALACLGRGNAAILLLIAGSWAVHCVLRRSLSPRLVAATGIAWALTMSPWWIHNVRVTGEFVPFHSLLWYNTYHDDVFDRAKRSLAARGALDLDVQFEYSRLPEDQQHPPGAILPLALSARDDLAQERRYRGIMLPKYRDPRYVAGKMARNAVDFWSAGGTVANDRKLLRTSLAWLALFAIAWVLAMRNRALRWPALVCSGFVALSWLLYLPIYALFRYGLPTTPFVAATIGLGLGSLMLRGGAGARAGSAEDQRGGGTGSRTPNTVTSSAGSERSSTSAAGRRPPG